MSAAIRPESFWAPTIARAVSVVREATIRNAPSSVIARITESLSDMISVEAHWRTARKRYACTWSWK
jgi:hypothetical protein